MIEFKQVSFAYNGVGEGKVEDLNFQIQTGECVVFTGESGCGKTTITRLLNGLIPDFFSGKLEGQILVNQEDIGQWELYEIAQKVGSVFQNPKTQFFNTDTDGEIAFGLENMGMAEEKMARRVKQTAETLQIESLLERNIFTLSGGEKQKIAFASVYAMNPEIYLLDEPSSNLDTEAIEELKKHIQILKKQGKTIIIAEHRLYYLGDVADRIFLMEKGEIRHVFSREEFQKMGEKVQKKLGLRALEYQTPVFKEEEKRNRAADLEVCNLSIGYNKAPVLSNINFSARKGDIVAIVGHNGVGKSTFSRTLCGLLKPLGGEVYWKGKKRTEKERLKVSYMVMQDVNYQLFADSVEHECGFGIKNPNLDQIEETLKKLGLYEYKNRHPNTLSGGQKQRVAVAVSMICKKDILIFDEPTSGLDYKSMCGVAKLLKDLANMGKVIFVVTHDFELMELACNRCLRLGEE